MTKTGNTNIVIKIASAALALVLIALFIIEIQYSFGAQNGRSSDRYLSLWNKQNKAPSEQQWQQALNQAQQANQLTPNNPANLRRLGLVYEWGEKIETIEPNTKLITTRIAQNYYKKVLALRSTSGWDWYRLFKTKTKLNQIDSEAETALTTAIASDPNNYDLLLYLVYYGLSSPQNSIIAENVNNATRHILQNAPLKHNTLYRHYQAYQQQTQLCQVAQQLSITSPALTKCDKT
jgi:cytochrome c-type biogenesis protein CcmH/NrfG